MNNLNDKINEIDSLTESQKDKMNPSGLIKDDLINFLSSQIRKLESKNDLKQKVTDAIIGKIDPEEEEDPPMTTSQLLKLFEILSKDENDAISNILDVIKKDSTGVIVNFNEKDEKKNNDEDISKEDMGKAKKILDVYDIVKKLKKSESSLDELENS